MYFLAFLLFGSLYMLDRVRSFINGHKLLDINGGVVLVGLSGGADSVSLLDILCRLGYDCVALHCNFHLRGEESERDESFAKAYAEEKRVPFYRIDFPTTLFAEKNRISIEMAARQLRYDWFEEMRIKLNAQAIAVAHHRDDSVETLLMNLMRGSGIRGLVGIRPKNGHVVRPLLCVSRQEVLNWLELTNQNYVTDSTNLSDEYTRNYIRLHILPGMEQLNPSVRLTLARSAMHLAAAEEIYMSVIEKAQKELWKENSLSVSRLLSYPAPETILYELRRPYGFTRQVVSSLFASLDGESGKSFYSPSGWRVIKDRDCLLIGKKETKQEVLVFAKEQSSQLLQNNPIEWQLLPYEPDFHFETNPKVAYFDYEKLADTLSLRHWEKGDWFVPFGMCGKKKVSDFYTDHKYSLEEKEKQWLLCSGNDIIWVVGKRADNRYKVTSATKIVLIVKKK